MAVLCAFDGQLVDRGPHAYRGGFVRARKRVGSHRPLILPTDWAIDRRVRTSQDGEAVSAVCKERSRAALTKRGHLIVR